ncbi:MAG: hypothetical protein RLZZ298_574 [Pseudomonadota bacterium]|jgi:acetyltransferase-like isoleucine patch superfamily enzyme
MKFIFKNPLARYLYYSLKNIFLELRYVNCNLLIGRNSRIISGEFGKYNSIYSNVVLNNVSLGDFTYIAESSKLNNVSVGKFCSIGPEVRIGLGKHPSRDFVSSHPIFFSTLKQAKITFVDKNYFNEFSSIKIGNDVWIGTRVIVVDGVVIGDGAILAAGAVVTKDIPPYAIAVGVPARVIRYRFKPGQIDFLMAFRWWDRDESWLRKNATKFNNIQGFIDDFQST